MEGPCGGCGKREAPGSGALAACFRCGRARYCGRDCQQLHWRREPDGHRDECSLLSPRRLQLADADSPWEQLEVDCADSLQRLDTLLNVFDVHGGKLQDADQREAGDIAATLAIGAEHRIADAQCGLGSMAFKASAGISARSPHCHMPPQAFDPSALHV
jgi:hypothetical protein